jgi:hypothetical protein
LIEQKLLRLEQMSSAEKIRYWVQERPWEIDGKRLRLPPCRSFSPSQIELDSAGNVTRMPLLLSRPCFGQPTAFLRHASRRFVYSPRQKSYQPTRCERCPVKSACAFVAEERLQSTPKLAELYREWRNLGGAEQTWPTNGPAGTAAVRVRELLLELQKMTFTTHRDQEVRDHYEQTIEAKLAEDRERKRRERERQAIEKARVGEITPEVERVLDGHRAWRAVEHRRAAAHPKAPRWLRQAQRNDSLFDASVWLAYTRISLRGRDPNPYSCAVELHRMGLELHRSVNALRDRVGRSIERMHRLQRLNINDPKDPVWPRFTLSELKEGLRLQPPTK